jgi:hypothetical protein
MNGGDAWAVAVDVCEVVMVMPPVLNGVVVLVLIGSDRTLVVVAAYCPLINTILIATEYC